MMIDDIMNEIETDIVSDAGTQAYKTIKDFDNDIMNLEPDDLRELVLTVAFIQDCIKQGYSIDQLKKTLDDMQETMNIALHLRLNAEQAYNESMQNQIDALMQAGRLGASNAMKQ
jgi:hypothetical protein